MKRNPILAALVILLTVSLSVNTNAQDTILKIGLLADIQYCNCETAGSRHYRLSLGKTRDAVQELLKEKVNLTVLLGDMIDRDVISFGPVLENLEPLQPDVILVPGNHDFAMGEGETANEKREELRSMCPVAKIQGHFRMLFLDGMKNSIEAWPAGSLERLEGLAKYKELKADNAPNAQEWNGGLGKEQLKWVRHQVMQANRKRQSLIIFCHLPALPGDVHSLWDTPQLLEIIGLSKKPVLYLCGHKHSGGDEQVGNCRIVNLKGMVEGTSNAFGILSVYRDRYELKGYGDQRDVQGMLK